MNCVARGNGDAFLKKAQGPSFLKKMNKYDFSWFCGDTQSLLLDSRLITPVEFQKYTYKVVKCGDYVQVYYYKKSRLRKSPDLEKLDINGLTKKESRGSPNNEKKHIEDRNIIRSKLSCQRLAKANAKHWKSFITLTYAVNMQDVVQAKKDLEYFITNIKKVKRDLMYIAIPEFQKRGAVHFHLLTNLSLQDNNIIKPQKTNDKYFDISYWKKGFSSFEIVEGDVKKIVGYISKYMTEECDDRLFNIRRFTSSQNLIKPVTTFISMKDKKGRSYFSDLLVDKECIYENTYIDNFNEEVQFMEFLSSVNIIYIIRS